MSAVRGVIFDLDGVLVHTDELHFLAWSTIARKLRIPFTRADNDRLRGVSRSESLEILLRLGGLSPSDAEKVCLAAEKNSEYVRLLDRLSPADVDPGVLKTLETLSARGLMLAIGSSSRNAKTILRRTGLAAWFDAISDGENITRSKPDPEVFLTAASLLGLDAGECIVVEDAQAGVEAAAAGGFDCVGIGDATTHPRVTWSVESLPELIAIVDRVRMDDEGATVEHHLTA